VPVGPAKFDRNRCNESPLRGEKPDIWPVSKFNTGSFAGNKLVKLIKHAAVLQLSLNSYSWERGSEPLTNSYCCTAVWPQLNKLVRATVHSAYQQITVYQYSGRDRPTQLHSRAPLINAFVNNSNLTHQTDSASNQSHPALFVVDSLPKIL